MIVIYAEKADVGKKIAAALDCIKLSDGTEVSFEELKKYEKEIKSQQRQGYFEITYEGKPCKVTWGSGHVCQLKQAKNYHEEYKSWSKLPVPFIPEHYEVMPIIGTYNPKGDEERMKRFKEFFNGAELIINATDFDREGEVIFGYLYEYLRCKTPFKRAHFTSQTKEGIQEGFHSLKASTEIKSMELAGRARSIADWDIGSNLTAQCTLKFGRDKEILSVGRVQTPTLNLFVEREKGIANFKVSSFWSVQAVFTTAEDEIYKASHTAERFSDKKDADAVLAAVRGNSGTVTKCDTVRGSRHVPLLYSLSALQMDANEKYGYTLAETLDLAQELYDGGYTTYPRTKSQYLTDDMRPVVTKTINMLEKSPTYAPFITGKSRSYENRFFDSSKVESHFAIIPTGNIPAGMNAKQINLYNLICFSVIRMLYRDAQIDKTSIVTTVAAEDFASNGSVIVDRGWMVVGDVGIREETLPMLHKGEVVAGEYTVTEGNTKPPKRYNDKSILAAMKTAGKDLPDKELKAILEDPSVEGIGTEATRANIIETLISRGYIERNGKAFCATDKGIFLIDNFPIEEMKSAEMTARWEKRLGNIAEQKEKYETFIADIEEATRKWSLQVKGIAASAAGKEIHTMADTTEFKCPSCEDGKMVKRSWGWGCSNYDSGNGCKCSFSNKILDKAISDEDFASLMEKGETPEIKGFISKKTQKAFDAKLVLNGGKIEFAFN